MHCAMHHSGYGRTPSDSLKRGRKQMNKMTLVGAAGFVTAVIGSGAVAWVYNGAATADHGNATNYVAGQGRQLIGATPNASIRSQWEREGLPN